MDFLVILGLYGTQLPATSTAHHLDYNSDGTIDIEDLMEHLRLRPQIVGASFLDYDE